jgi:branched-chain amino acid transport system permease protein
VAGALWAHQLTAFSPRSFFIAASVPIIVMAVLGGIGSVVGAIVGTILLTSWLEFIRRVEAGSIGPFDLPDLTGIAQLTVGVGLILVLWKRRAGVMGASELELGHYKGGTSTGESDP